MRSVRKMYEDMTTAPTRPSMGHDKRKMDVARTLFGGDKVEKMAKGGCSCRGDGIAQRGKTRGRIV